MMGNQMGPMMNQPMPRMNYTEQMGQSGQMGTAGGMQAQGGLQMSRSGQSPRTDGLNMSNLLPSEVIESPTSMNEAYLGSLKAMLLRNKGNYIVANFLVGTQNTVSWEGILYEVGNDYVTIYQPGRDRYVVIDMYSLKYMEFYDTQRREMCNRLLAERGYENDAMPGMNGMGGMSGMNPMMGVRGTDMSQSMNSGEQRPLASEPRGW